LRIRRVSGKAQSYDMAKIVEKYGSLYRLTDADYRRLLTAVAAGKEYDLWELGAHIGYIHASMANFEKDDAEFELSRLGSGPVRKPVSGNVGRGKISRLNRPLRGTAQTFRA
jgi:hypothetical protein